MRPVRRHATTRRIHTTHVQAPSGHGRPAIPHLRVLFLYKRSASIPHRVMTRPVQVQSALRQGQRRFLQAAVTIVHVRTPPMQRLTTPVHGDNDGCARAHDVCASAHGVCAGAGDVAANAVAPSVNDELTRTRRKKGQPCTRSVSCMKLHVITSEHMAHPMHLRNSAERSPDDRSTRCVSANAPWCPATARPDKKEGTSYERRHTQEAGHG